MLSSVISPVMATNKANEVGTCPACSTKPNTEVAVIEVKGMEKNEAIAKALKNEDVKKLMNEFVKHGHKPELVKATVNKIIGKYGEATYVYIPFKAKGCEAGLGYLITEEGSKALATELSKEAIRMYYVNAEGVVQERVVQAGEVGILGTGWDCAECGAAITLVILCCVGTSGTACWACVIASGILAACDCVGCCCWLGYGPCCDAEETYC